MLLFITFLAATLTACSDAIASNVTISGRSLLVDGLPYFIQGVTYNPVPIGSNNGAGDYLVNASYYTRDLPNIAAMGANTIRTYSFYSPNNYAKYANFLNNCTLYGIKVMAGFAVSIYSNYSDTTTRNNIIGNWTTFVTQFKDHPAILMWLFGNEQNTTDLASFHSLVDECRQQAHSIEGDLAHPVTTPIADSSSLASRVLNYDYSVDLWAFQLYRGSTFGDVWNMMRTNSTKPMVLSEFGVDAYDTNLSAENAAAQATYDSNLFQEIQANTDVGVGATVFQWMDGWWKGGNVSVQLPTGKSCSGSPNDKFCNQAYYGINSIAAGSPNVVTPRQAYYSLQTLFQKV